MFVTLIFFMVCVSITTSTIIKPTIINSTGEYYIADDTSFINNAINCNSTKHCYIVCGLMGSCNSTMISCSSPTCDLTCSAPNACSKTQFNINTTISTAINLLCSNTMSCLHTNINAISSNPTTTLTTRCTNTTSCFNSSWTANNLQLIDIIHEECDDCLANTYNLQYIEKVNINHNGAIDFEHFVQNTFWDIYNVRNSKRIDMLCNGQYSCLLHQLNINNSLNYSSTVTVQCQGSNGCTAIGIFQSPQDILNLTCIDGPAVCNHAMLLVSPLSNHTNIVCNGTEGSQACNGLNITVPSDYTDDFVSFNFINKDGQNTNKPLSGSFDSVIIQCLDQKLCTNYTSFPLLYGTATPTKIIGNTVYYNSSIPYQYGFQSLSCKAGQECFIHCDHDQTCTNSFIQCEDNSTCHIYCNNQNECQRTVVKAYGDAIDFQCLYGEIGGSCNNADIWLPDSFSNGYLNISSCNEHESCDNLEFMCMNKNKNNFTLSEFEWNGARYVCENEGCCPWNTDNNNNTYRNITCTNPECNIDCNNDWGNPYYPPFGCQGLIIDGTSTNTKSLNIDCSSGSSCQNAIIYCPMDSCNIHCGLASCSNITIYANSTENVTIGCMEKSSCNTANINVHDTRHFNIVCSYTSLFSGDGSCDNSNIFINSTNGLSGNVDIHCTGCSKMNLLSTSNNTRILCDGSCKGSTMSSLSGDNLSVTCIGSYTCQDLTILSNLTRNVFVDCNYNASGDWFSCFQSKIYGYSVNNLEVKCNATSCLDTYIETTTVNNGVNDRNNVSLICGDWQACTRVNLNANYMSMVSVFCAVSYSCDQNNLNVSNSKYFRVKAINGSVGDISISHSIFNIESVEETLFDFSEGWEEQTTINANNINNLNIICNISNDDTTNYMPQCGYLNLNANNVNDSINWICDGSRACSANTINIGNVDNLVNVWCNGQSACTFMEFDVVNEVNNVNITCNNVDACAARINATYANLLNVYSFSDDIYGSYHDLTVITPQKANSTNIYCGGTGCWSPTFIISNSHGLDDLNFIWSGDCECSSVHNCIDEWNITCNDGESTIFDGNKCNANSDTCCSTQSVNRIENKFNDYYHGNVTNCYTPSDDNKANGLVIGLVVALVVVVVIAAVIGGLYYHKKRKLAAVAQTEEYQKINN